MHVRQGLTLARRAFAAWSGDYAPSMGAALSYYSIFSMAPLLLIVIGVAGFFFGQEAARGEIFGQIDGLVGREGAQAIEGLLASARRPSSGVIAMILGMVVLLAGASTVFGELQNALDRIWRVPIPKERSLWRLMRARVLSFGMILGIAFLLMVSLVLSAVVSALGDGWGWMGIVDLGLSFALTTVLFAMIYKVIPRTPIAWRDVWTGAAVTAALFALGKLLIGLYLGRSSVASVFGAAGSLVVTMVWVYYSAQIFLLGAEFTRLYAEEHGSRSLEPAVRGIRVQPAANAPVMHAPRATGTVARLGAALALGIGASIGFNFWRKR
jgi:membrane protein